MYTRGFHHLQMHMETPSNMYRNFIICVYMGVPLYVYTKVLSNTYTQGPHHRCVHMDHILHVHSFSITHIHP